jgi:hypothetical protein
MAEVTTDARIMATSDIFNAVTFAAMNNSMVVRKNVCPELIMNFDTIYTTQFTVGGNGDENVTVVYLKEEKKKMQGPLKAKPKKGEQGFTKYSIK